MYFHRAVYIETHPLGWVITTFACTIQAHISTVLSPTRKETSSEAYQRRARFQHHQDASYHQGFFFFLQGKAPKEIHAILTETLACFLPGRAMDLAAPLYMLY